MRRSFGIAAVCRAVCLALLLKLGGFFGTSADAKQTWYNVVQPVDYISNTYINYIDYIVVLEIYCKQYEIDS